MIPGRSVTSRVLAVLEAFTDRRPCLTLSEIARQAGLPTPTAHRLVGELGRASRSAVHRVDLLEVRQVGLGQDAPPLLGVVAVQPDDQRVRDLIAPALQQRERLDDAVGHLVTRRDAAEDVDEHTAHVRVGQDDLQPVRHHFGGRTAADVEEVRRLDLVPVNGELLARVRHYVERRHDQARAVADDADLTVELDVVEILLLGPGLERVGRRG